MWRKPIWTEGLFLSQHHFQNQDLYHELSLRERIAAVRRFSWGILDLAIDERLLQAGQFGLTRFEAIWPDGMVVRCGGAGEVPMPEPRSFESAFGAELPQLEVLVAMTGESTSANVAAPGESVGQRRFSRTTQSVPDFNAGGAPQDIEVAVPNLRIVFGNERREKVSPLPVAQLVRQANGQIVVRDTFVPPVMRISAAPFLKSGLGRVLGSITARQRELAAARKQRTASNIEFHFTDARRFWLLHTLNSSIPWLLHLLETEGTHPEEVYLALAQVMGALCTFSPDADPSTIARFNYLELGDVFEQLFARIISLLAIDSVPVYVEIPLERRSDGMFVGKVPEPRLMNHEFFVAVKSGLPEPIVRERVPQLLKVASWNHILEVVKQARHGIRSEIEWNPSSSLPVKPGLCFFKLRREGAFWEEVVKSSTIALYLPTDADWKETWLSVYAIDGQYLR